MSSSVERGNSTIPCKRVVKVTFKKDNASVTANTNHVSNHALSPKVSVDKSRPHLHPSLSTNSCSDLTKLAEAGPLSPRRVGKPEIVVSKSTLSLSSSASLSPSVRPPPNRQLADIQRLLQQHVVEGAQVVYVIEAEWMLNWCNYVNNNHVSSQKTTTSMSTDVKSSFRSPANVTEPGVIRNDLLLHVSENDEKSTNRENQSQNIHGSNQLRDDLFVQEDCFLLPQTVWQALVSWFGIQGPVLSRKIAVKSETNTSTTHDSLDNRLLLMQQPLLLRAIFATEETYACFVALMPRTTVNDDVPHNDSQSLRSEQEYLQQLLYDGVVSTTRETTQTCDTKEEMSTSVDAITDALQQTSLDDQTTTKNAHATTNSADSHPNTPSPVAEKVSDQTESSASDSTSTLPAAQTPKMSRPCHVCHLPALTYCSRCKKVHYCSKTCQQTHWKFHKKECTAPSSAATTPTTQSTDAAMTKTARPTSTSSTTTNASAPANGALTARVQRRLGLVNLGNTCYLSSSLQCLLSIAPLNAYFLSQKYLKDVNVNALDGTKGQLVHAYYRLLQEMRFDNVHSAVKPQQFKNILGSVREEYRGFAQQDAHEVIELLLDKFHEDLNRVLKKPYVERLEGDGHNDFALARDSWRNHKLRDDSAITDLFGSLMRSQLTCTTCAHRVVTYEYHNSIEVAIPRAQTASAAVSVPAPVSAPSMDVVFWLCGEVLPAHKLQVDAHRLGLRHPSLQQQQRRKGRPDFVSVNPDSGYSLQTLGLSGISGALTLKELELQLQSQLPAVYQEHQGKYDWFFFECDRIPAAQDEEVETEVEMSIGTNGETMQLTERPVHMKAQLEENTPIHVLDFATKTYCVYLLDASEAANNYAFVYLRFLRPLDTSRKQQQQADEDEEENNLDDAVAYAYWPVPLLLTFDVNTTRCASLHLHVYWNLLRLCAMTDANNNDNNNEAYLAKILRLIAAKDVKALNAHAKDDLVLRWINQNGSGVVSSSDKLALKQTDVTNDEKARIEEVLTLGSLLPFDMKRSIAECTGDVRRVYTQPWHILSADFAFADVPVKVSTKALCAALDPSLMARVSRHRPLNPDFAVARFNYIQKLKAQQAQLQRQRQLQEQQEQQPVTLQQCLHEYCKQETLEEGNEWYCSTCKVHQKATKVVSFCAEYLPQVLVITLKRFEFRAQGLGSQNQFNPRYASSASHLLAHLSAGTQREKIETLVHFPLESLNLTPFCGETHYANRRAERGGDEREDEEDGEEAQCEFRLRAQSIVAEGIMYDLFAVCNHYGRMGFGHYTSVVRDWETSSSPSDVTWFFCDDESIRPVPAHDVHRVVQTASAYVLFYRRRV